MSPLADYLPSQSKAKSSHRFDVEKDVGAMIWSLRLHSVRRYEGQRYWEDETREAIFGDRVEPGLKLENVSAHSWHVADSVLLLAGHFPHLSLERALSLSIIHDKLEIITGDYNPIGRDGQGTNTHAFDNVANLVKLSDEKHALRSYLHRLGQTAAVEQRHLFEEWLTGKTREALFVKAVNKLQSLAFIYVKKDGRMTDNHLKFTLRYGAKSYHYFPELRPYYDAFATKILNSVAARRKCKVQNLIDKMTEQLELEL